MKALPFSNILGYFLARFFEAEIIVQTRNSSAYYLPRKSSNSCAIKTPHSIFCIRSYLEKKNPLR